MGTNLLFIIFTILIINFNLYSKDLCINCHGEHIKSSCVSCHRGNPDTKRIGLAHYKIISGKFLKYKIDKKIKEDGDILIKNLGCRRCHIIGKSGNNKGNDLNKIIKKKTTEEIILAIQNPGYFMPDFKIYDSTLILLMNALFSSSNSDTIERGVNMIYFKRQQLDNIFDNKCGSCHRLISDKLGFLGKSGIAPNLSGILTEYYPKTKNLKSNTPEDIKIFLKNPRSYNKNSIMPPQEISDIEIKNILETLK